MAGLQLQKRQASESPPRFTINFAVPEPRPSIHKIRRRVLVQLKDSKKNQRPERLQPIPVQDNYITNLRTNFDAKLSSDSSTGTLPIRPGMNSTSSSSSTFNLGSIFTKSETNTTSASSILTANGAEISIESQSSSWRLMRKAKKKIRFLSDLPPDAGNTNFAKPVIDSTEEQSCQAPLTPAPEEILNTNSKIDSLCSTLKTPVLDIDYLGYLSDDEHQQHEFRLLKDTTSSSQALEETSLEGLLANKGQLTLSRQKRYKIASVLASSLLQLQNTPWLAENLEKKNILFYHNGSDVFVDEPYINHSFTPTKVRQVEKNTDVPRTLPRKTLSSLGILLLELCFGDAIENQTEMRKSHLSSDGKALEGTDYLTAIEWLDKVAEEQPKIAPIIKWCIFCLFEGKPNWSDTTFIQAVYSSVVRPLEMLLAPT